MQAGFFKTDIGCVSDINECVEVKGICEGGECQNTFGSYLCRCPDGYRLDGDKHRCVGQYSHSICRSHSCDSQDVVWSYYIVICVVLSYCIVICVL